jgi:predicted AAA+ superfamily ATPase
MLLVVALGELQLGPTTALNALLEGASLYGKSSFVIATLVLLWRSRDALPKGR